jgi:predicted CXXCH cytochrome family protein
MIKGILLTVLLTAFLPTAAFSAFNHDFSAEGWSTGERCSVCHLVHNATPGMPLWRRSLGGPGFLPYTASATMDATPTDNSNGCLTCHDGTTSIDSSGQTTVYVQDYSGRPGVNLGQDGTNDHPINFVFDDALAILDGRLAIPSASDGDPYRVEGLPVDFFDCQTCHAIHGSPWPKLLRTDNTGSGLCLTCHLK